MKTKIYMLCCLIGTGTAAAQSFSEKITRELSFEKKGNNAVMIFNINGPVSVVGYAGDKVVIEVEKTIRAKTDARLEKGKKEIQLGVIDRADTLLLYVSGTCNTFGKEKRSRGHDDRSGTWGYHWNNCGRGDDNCREEYDYTMKFTLKIPQAVNLYAATINDGDIRIENIAGKVYANNINGSIALKSISGSTDASTINGSVDLEYAQNPIADCRYYSLNGDINANFRKGLTANVSFKSFNGGLYTNVDQLVAVPSPLEKRNDGDGLRYKIGGSRYQVGKGGVLLDFETFNGDAYLKEKTN
jgi:hypothetical protein